MAQAARSKQLKKSEQMISRHALHKTPVADIRTQLTLAGRLFRQLRDETDKSAQEHYIDIIQGASQALKDMLEELFMFTKLKTDSFKLELSNYCSQQTLKQTVFSYYEEWKKQGIEPLFDIWREDTIFITANAGAQAGVSECDKNALVHGTE